MYKQLNRIVNLNQYPLQDESFRNTCKVKLDQAGVLVMPDFLLPEAIESIRREGKEKLNLAYFKTNQHNVYLTCADPDFPDDHPRNRQVLSSKGCITDDQIDQTSELKVLYNSSEFRDFLCVVLDEQELHEYADLLSSVNLHYTQTGQELGWHFDNSSFAITLMIQNPEKGGVFEYVKDIRNAEAGEMNYEDAGKVLDGEMSVNTLSMESGALVLFRGRDSMHRVTPVEGDRTRMLAVLAYNSKPGVSLSESARMTFYGRL